MPTENRSSNTEMVSLSRDLIDLTLAHLPNDSAAKWELHEVLARPAPQPHPEPIAWMVGTAFWWTKAEAERDAAQTGLPIVPVGPLISIPDGYCLMPKRLTAENGAKALLLGEFKLEVTQECPECRELDEPVEGCEICDGEGEYGQRHTIPWELIKYIYSEAVKGLALQPRRSVANP
ncbi:hypothetical protein C4Q28_11050 [Pseudomonas sp. SWI6]|uniref:hypothetical protein n=1 Tax=Pseudomonas sp. SWI6 TaxID=2083051 RepID=UPI000CE5F045|nr:hypothetical protein [Pseudomonas sp. SWI6]AVD82649.1 hypothetical protein C4Q28_11050 [Pseudomonas sp. SWI6]